ncbi:hypothetical protein ACWWJ2_09570, partial [Pseudomonas aeruginosa]
NPGDIALREKIMLGSMQAVGQVRQRLVDHLIAFKHAVGFHESLALHGVGSSDIPFLSRHAMQDPCILTNPRESSQRDVEVVYGEAL